MEANKSKTQRQPKHVVGSNNVFADVNLPQSQELLAKAQLAQKITSILDERRFTQLKAGELLGIDQPKISALKRGRLSGFSLERLIRFLNLLDQDVQISTKARPRSRTQARLKVA